MIEKNLSGRGVKMCQPAFLRWFYMLWVMLWCLDDVKVIKMGPRVHDERRWILKIVRFTNIKRLFLQNTLFMM